MSEQNANPLEQADRLAKLASTVFRPRTPITTKQLFAGRWAALTEISDAVHQAGLHVVIYGERGVGKTSLANVIGATIQAIDELDAEEAGLPQPSRLVLKAVANSGDTFSAIWTRLLADLTWPLPEGGDDRVLSTRLAFGLGNTMSIDDVRRVLGHMPGAVFIIDEFDQARREVSKDFTELIKALSDLATDCTVVLVGVSQTVDNLVTDHASIHRALQQIRLERMKPDELGQILKNAEKVLDLKFDEDAAGVIVNVSQGLPHYTHLIGLHAVRSAAHRLALKQVAREDVFEALKKAVKQAEQTVTDRHSTAIHSSHKRALYRQVLLACALAATRTRDPLGYFSPSGVVEPLQTVLGRDVSIATFTNHLGEFCDEKRGAVLERDGQPWGYRYRFNDPLLVPFIFMDGLEAGITTGHKLVAMLNEGSLL